MEIKDLFKILRTLAPGLSEHDFSGFQLGTDSDPLSKLGVCVDPTAKNIENAVKMGIKVLISYHPWQGESGETVQNGEIMIWPLHEAWDNAAGGVTQTLSAGIGLTGPYCRGELVIGGLETDFRDLIERCQRFIGLNVLAYSGDLRQKVAKIALWAGPGFLPNYKKFWELSLAEECDTLLSSELTLSALRYSRSHQLKLIDLGHSPMAKPAMSRLADVLRGKIRDCQVFLLDDLYTCNYYTNCSFAEQFTESEDLFFETGP